LVANCVRNSSIFIKGNRLGSSIPIIQVLMRKEQGNRFGSRLYEEGNHFGKSNRLGSINAK